MSTAHLEEVLSKKRSHHVFSRRALTEAQIDEVSSIIASFNLRPGPFGFSPRIHMCLNNIGDFIFKNVAVWALGSVALSKNMDKMHQEFIDLGYKLFRMSIELEKRGYVSCFTAKSIDVNEASERCASYHTLGHEFGCALAIGLPEEKKSLRSKITDSICGDGRKPALSSFVKNAQNGILAEVLERASVCPFLTLFRPYTIEVEDKRITFKTTSRPNKYSYLSVGLMMGAVEESLIASKIKCDWCPADGTIFGYQNYVTSCTAEL